VSGDRASSGRPGVVSPATPPRPFGICLEGTEGPTNSRAGGIHLVEGKAQTGFDLYPSFALLSRKWGSPKIDLDHPHDPSMFLLQTDGVAGARGYALDSQRTKEERLIMDMLR
jgi:hypothetical protein